MRRGGLSKRAHVLGALGSRSVCRRPPSRRRVKAICFVPTIEVLTARESEPVPAWLSLDPPPQFLSGPDGS